MRKPKPENVFMKLAVEREAVAEERKRQRIAAGLPAEEPGGLTPEQIAEARGSSADLDKALKILLRR